MTAPPGITGTTEPSPGIRRVGVTEPTPKREALRHLSAELGISGAQANVLYAAYRRDLERPLATADKVYRTAFIDWLMRQAPSARKPSKRKWRLGEAGWRVTS